MVNGRGTPKMPKNIWILIWNDMNISIDVVDFTNFLTFPQRLSQTISWFYSPCLLDCRCGWVTGWWISLEVTADTSSPAMGEVSLLTIAGASFLGTHGVAERLMASLAKVGVNVTWLQFWGWYDCMMTVWWLYDDCMMTVWWLYDDCMMTVWCGILMLLDVSVDVCRMWWLRSSHIPVMSSSGLRNRSGDPDLARLIGAFHFCREPKKHQASPRFPEWLGNYGNSSSELVKFHQLWDIWDTLECRVSRTAIFGFMSFPRWQCPTLMASWPWMRWKMLSSWKSPGAKVAWGLTPSKWNSCPLMSDPLMRPFHVQFLSAFRARRMNRGSTDAIVLLVSEARKERSPLHIPRVSCATKAARNTETRAALREDSLDKRSSCDRNSGSHQYKPHTDSYMYIMYVAFRC